MQYETPAILAATDRLKNTLQSREHEAWAKARERVGNPEYTLPERIDRGYVIILLKQILEQINKHKLNAHEMSYSLSHSLRALLAKLEVDSQQTEMPDHIKEEMQKHAMEQMLQEFKEKARKEIECIEVPAKKSKHNKI